jgi:hypothetical protein
MALKLHNRKLYPFVFLVWCAAVVAVWARFWHGLQPELLACKELLVSALGAVGGFTYFLYRQHLDETKLFKELFVEFNARYEEMNDGLNKILYGPQEGMLSASEQDLLFSYFNLSAEEFLFYKAGYIDQRAWKSWRKGMDIFLKHPLINALWRSESANDSYYGFKPWILEN